MKISKTDMHTFCSNALENYFNYELVEHLISDDVKTLVDIMNDKSVHIITFQFSNKYSINEILDIAEYLPTLILSNSNMSKDFFFVYLIEGKVSSDMQYLSLLSRLFHSFYEIEPKYILDLEDCMYDKSLSDWQSNNLIYKIKFQRGEFLNDFTK